MAPLQKKQSIGRISFLFAPLPLKAYRLLHDKVLKPIDLLVLGLVVRMHLMTNNSFLSDRAIAEELGVAASTVGLSVARLKKCGIAFRKKVPRPDPQFPDNRSGWLWVFASFTSDEGHTTESFDTPNSEENDSEQ